jgi:hypothetical protein
MRNSNPPLGTCLLGRISKGCSCHLRRPSSTLTPPVQERTYLRDAEGPTGRQQNNTAGRWKPNDSWMRPRIRRTRWKTGSGQERETMETAHSPRQGPAAPWPQGGARGRPGAPQRKKPFSRNESKGRPRGPQTQDKTPKLHLILNCTYQKTPPRLRQRHLRRCRPQA